MTIQEILNSDDLEAKKALFIFNKDDSNEAVRIKFNLWSRHHFPKFFTSKDAPFHKDLDLANIEAYRGQINSFTDIAFRGASKTSRTKLFIAFVILNDTDRTKKYIKILSADLTNSKQITTDIYNMLISCEELYPNTFLKTDLKREETMASFTTYTEIKVIADTVNVDQRGALQNEARPDLILFEDFETRKTLRSATITKMIWDNMEEARTSLSKEGASIYNCNYLSERGNVHKLVLKKDKYNKVLIIPILDKEGNSTWPARFTKEDIAQMKLEDDDFEGERMCEPSASNDIFFNRDILDKMEPKELLEDRAGFKIFYKFDPSHRIGSGHDVAGGVGLDSSTSVFIDFDTVPARVVATYKNNLIKPDVFGYEVKRESSIFGDNVAAIEKNNHGHTTIAIAKQEGVNQYFTQGKTVQIENIAPKEYGWLTNGLSKPKMLFALAKAIEDGLLTLSDADLIQECKSYSRDDMMDRDNDPRLTTRHFDLLIACAIAWQMKDFASIKTIFEYEDEPEVIHSDIGI